MADKKIKPPASKESHDSSIRPRDRSQQRLQNAQQQQQPQQQQQEAQQQQQQSIRPPSTGDYIPVTILTSGRNPPSSTSSSQQNDSGRIITADRMQDALSEIEQSSRTYREPPKQFNSDSDGSDSVEMKQPESMPSYRVTLSSSPSCYASMSNFLEPSDDKQNDHLTFLKQQLTRLKREKQSAELALSAFRLTVRGSPNRTDPEMQRVLGDYEDRVISVATEIGEYSRKISQIQRLRNSFKNNIPLPALSRVSTGGLDHESLKIAVPKTTEDPNSLQVTLHKLNKYATANLLTEDEYRQALHQVLQGKHYDTFHACRDKLLEDSLQVLCDTFVTGNSLPEKNLKLQTFVREPGATIRQTMARLETLLDETEDMAPAGHAASRKREHMISTLKKLASPSAVKVLCEKEQVGIRSGQHLTVRQAVTICEEEELKNAEGSLASLAPQTIVTREAILKHPQCHCSHSKGTAQDKTMRAVSFSDKKTGHDNDTVIQVRETRPPSRDRTTDRWRQRSRERNRERQSTSRDRELARRRSLSSSNAPDTTVVARPASPFPTTQSPAPYRSRSPNPWSSDHRPRSRSQSRPRSSQTQETMPPQGWFSPFHGQAPPDMGTPRRSRRPRDRDNNDGYRSQSYSDYGRSPSFSRGNGFPALTWSTGSDSNFGYTPRNYTNNRHSNSRPNQSVRSRNANIANYANRIAQYFDLIGEQHPMWQHFLADYRSDSTNRRDGRSRQHSRNGQRPNACRYCTNTRPHDWAACRDRQQRRSNRKGRSFSRQGN